MDTLQQHIAAASQHHLLGRKIDFKLSASPGPRNKVARKESGFDKLAVTVRKVTILFCMCFQRAFYTARAMMIWDDIVPFGICDSSNCCFLFEHAQGEGCL